MNNNFTAKQFNVFQWVDANGKPIKPIELSDLNGKFKVLFCFQNWCEGCHSKGIPDLMKLIKAFKNNNEIVFLAIQTVFEGYHVNTYEKMVETQKKYQLKIPFGHDAGDDGDSRSNIMTNYQTGGTPWFILIDKKNDVVFSDFHLNPDAAIKYLKDIQ